jgi:hypothetical protein
MRPRLPEIATWLVAMTAVVSCNVQQEGLRGPIAAPGVVGGDKPTTPNDIDGMTGEPDPYRPPARPDAGDAGSSTVPPSLTDAAPPTSDAAPPTSGSSDASPSPVAADAGDPSSDATPPPINSRPAACDEPAKLPLPVAFRRDVPDSDDFTFDHDGYFLARAGRDIARLAYGGQPEMVVRNVVGERNTIDSLRVLPSGAIVIADYTGDAITRIELSGDRRKVASLHSPNKLTMGPNGRLYIVGIEGDIYMVDMLSGNNRLIGRVDGRLRGLTFSVDYQTLYVSDARNNVLHSLQLHEDGTADMPRVFARGLGGGPDGLATDACGNIYVADHGSNGLRRVSPKGAVEVIANLPAPTSSVGFGSGRQGWDAKTLYTVSVERGGTAEIKLGLPAAPPPPP